MTHKKFDAAKEEYIKQGLNPTAAGVLAFIDTGETDGSVQQGDNEDTSNWTEEDWYQNNLKIGMSEKDARFSAAIEAGELDIDEPGGDY